MVSGEGGIWAAMSRLTLASATGAGVGVAKAVGVAATGGGAKVAVGGGGEVGSATATGVAVAAAPQATRVKASTENAASNRLLNLIRAKSYMCLTSPKSAALVCLRWSWFGWS